MNSFIEGLSIALSYPAVIWIVVGMIIGIIIGAIPGIGPGLGMALIIPLTVPMEPTSAIILLVSVYSGGMYGGSISSILINTPGHGGAAATTLDGYPMSRQGKSLDAISISAVSSAFGGMIGVTTLILVSPIIVEIVLLFRSADYFLIAFIGLSMIAIIAKGAMFKGIMAGSFGLLLSTIGFFSMSPVPRFSFENYVGNIFYDGLSFIALLIGVFAVTEMLRLSTESGSIAKESDKIGGNLWTGFSILAKYPIHFLKSSYLGMIVGAIPGAGSSIATWIAYGEAKRTSEDSDSFGKGNPIGILATESCNNGTIGGAIIPTFTFGIPGGGSTAVLLGGLIMHGLQPGPDLFSENLHITYSIFISLLIGNIIILIFGLTLASETRIITQVRTDYIIPIVMVLAVIGGFAIRSGNWVDVFSVIIFGIVGYAMVKYDYSIIAFVLGMILGPIAESNLHRSLQISHGSLSIFFARPLSAILSLILIFLLLTPIFKQIFGEVDIGIR